MTENKHTPGPWELERPVHPNDLKAQIIAHDRPPYKTHIATVYADPRGEHTPAPNARLIAAAPALVKVVQYFDYAASNCKVGALSNDEYVTITVTVKSIRDARAALVPAKEEAIDKEGGDA